MKKRYVNLMEVQLPGVDPNTGVMLNNMVDEWGSSSVPQLSVVLVELRFLYVLHQTHHWIAKGDPFYGDHKLFERLYTATLEEIDRVGERAVGKGDESNVNMTLQLTQLQRLGQSQGASATVPSADHLARRSLQAEKDFLIVLNQLVVQMKEQGTLSRGIDNMLAQIEDDHESHVYMLKQRCGG